MDRTAQRSQTTDRPIPIPVGIRDAADADMPAIQAIYAEQVLKGTATFEEVPPSVSEMAARHANVLALGLPYLVAERDGQVVAYAYATGYRPRAAYRFTIENSVYVAATERGGGVGRQLLGSLIERCERGPWRQMIAVIGDSANRGSIRLHESLGFVLIGRIEGAGFKFGRWVDTVLMQRALNGGITTLPAHPPGTEPEPMSTKP